MCPRSSDINAIEIRKVFRGFRLKSRKFLLFFSNSIVLSMSQFSVAGWPMRIKNDERFPIAENVRNFAGNELLLVQNAFSQNPIARMQKILAE